MITISYLHGPGLEKSNDDQAKKEAENAEVKELIENLKSENESLKLVQEKSDLEKVG
jgi:hypothetical protein